MSAVLETRVDGCVMRRDSDSQIVEASRRWRTSALKFVKTNSDRATIKPAVILGPTQCEQYAQGSALLCYLSLMKTCCCIGLIHNASMHGL